MERTPMLLIRPTNRIFTAIGELLDVTNAPDINGWIIDCGEVKPGETSADAARRKREKHRYEENLQHFARDPKAEHN